jgi:hypothetical protein
VICALSLPLCSPGYWSSTPRVSRGATPSTRGPASRTLIPISGVRHEQSEHWRGRRKRQYHAAHLLSVAGRCFKHSRQRTRLHKYNCTHMHRRIHSRGRALKDAGNIDQEQKKKKRGDNKSDLHASTGDAWQATACGSCQRASSCPSCTRQHWARAVWRELCPLVP